MRDAWYAIKGEMTNQIDVHHNRGTVLSKDIGLEMKKFKDEQFKLRKQYLSDAFKVNSERKRLEKAVYTVKNLFEV